MKYFRIHTEDIAWLTKQPRGLFTAVGKLVDERLLTEQEEKEYWRNRAYSWSTGHLARVSAAL